MPETPAAPSLIDDVEFLAELDQLEHRPRTGDAVPRTSAFEALTPAPAFAVADEVEEPAGPDSRRAWPIALTIAWFGLMTGLGAAAAAFVFHERLAALLAR
jgi:hypothetical protein